MPAPLLTFGIQVGRQIFAAGARFAVKTFGARGVRRFLRFGRGTAARKGLLGEDWESAHLRAFDKAGKAGALLTAKSMRRASPVRTGRMRRAIRPERRFGRWTVVIPRRKFPDRYYPRFYFKRLWRAARKDSRRIRRRMKQVYKREMRR